MAVLQKELFQDKLEVINSSLVADYYIAQLVRAPWLVNLAGRISLHGSFHLNSEICKLRPWFFSAQIYACVLRAWAINPSGKNSFRNLQYRPRTRLLYTVVLVTGRVITYRRCTVYNQMWEVITTGRKILFGFRFIFYVHNLQKYIIYSLSQMFDAALVYFYFLVELITSNCFR